MTDVKERRRHVCSRGIAITLRVPLRAFLLLALLPRRITCQSSGGGGNDPSHLCTSSDGSAKHTGYKATRDCRGYVYCSDGYLMGGGEAVTNAVTGTTVQPGVIPCWPNQLYDEALGICTYWQDVDTGNCPEFDGSMIMPDLTDGNANEDLFFCGASASNARSVCEPCPGGSRLECSDVTHNCFAGITGCSSSEPLPSVSTEVISVQSAEPTLQDVAAAPSRSPAAFVVQSSQPMGTALSTEVILVQSAEPTLQDVVAAPSRSPSVSEQALVVQSSQPTGTALSTEVILVQSDEPMSQNVVAAPSRSPAVSEQALVVQSAEPTSDSDGSGGYQNPSGNTFFCGETYDKIDEQCFTSKPCPSGRGSDYCANHEGCFSVPSCTAQYESAVDAISPPPPTMSPNSSMQPSTKPVNAPTSRVTSNPSKQSVSNLPMTASPSKAPTVNTHFCGITWDDHIQNCASSTPCPRGDECPSGEQCFATSPCVISNIEEDSSFASPTSQPEIVADESVTQSTASPFYFQSTSSPFNSPTTSSPSKAPTVNTNFCGITWDDHTRNCESSTPCPRGDECPSGEQCFTISPCATLNSQEDVDVESTVGSFCSTEWNLLLSTCETATRCPNGDECADDEFCYIDFVCDPQQVPINNTTSSTAATDLLPDINSQGNGCELCGASIDGPLYHIRRNVMVDFYGDEISCVDLANKIILMFGPASDQCLEILGTHSTDCCFEACSLCGDDWEDTVFIPKEEAICHELDSKKFVEEGVASDSERCKTSQSFYSETCCTQTPDEPCDLCTLNGVNFYMKSNVAVSYKGEVQTCLQVYHSLYSRIEESSEHCINAQGDLFMQCCEANSTPIPALSPTGESTMSHASATPVSPDIEVGSWYAGSLMTSASLSTASICSFSLPITVLLYALMF